MGKSVDQIMAIYKEQRLANTGRNEDYHKLHGFYAGQFYNQRGVDAMDGSGRLVLRDTRRGATAQPLVANLLKGIVDDFVSMTGGIPDIKVPAPGEQKSDQDFADMVEKYHYGVWHASNMTMQLKSMAWYHSVKGGCSGLVWPNFRKRHAEIRFVGPEKVYGIPDMIDPFAFSSAIIAESFSAASIKDYFPQTQVQDAIAAFEMDRKDWTGRKGRVEIIRFFDKSEVVTVMGREVTSVKARAGETPEIEALVEMGRATHDLGLCPVVPFQNIFVPGEHRGQCLPASEMVMTNPRGPVSIAKLKPGDKVYSAVPTIHVSKRPSLGGPPTRIAPAKVKAVIDNGVRPIFKVRTGGSTLRATANHPVLAVRYRGPKTWKNSLRQMAYLDWVPVDELSVGDLVVQVDSISAGADRRHIDPDWAWLVGLWLGDGWLRWSDTKTARREKYRGMPKWAYPGKAVSRVEIATFNRADAQRCHDIVLRKYGAESVVGDKVWGVNSKRFAEDLVRLGVAHPDTRAHNKRIPLDAWKWTKQAQRALLEGLFASDGCEQGTTTGAVRIELSSEGLIADIRGLCQMVGYHTTNTHRRRRSQEVAFPQDHGVKRPHLILPSWNIGVVRRPLHGRRAKGLSERIGQTWWTLRIPRGCRLDRVRSIEPDGEERVYDIEVEGSHNFVTDRFIAHNSDIEQAVGLNMFMNFLLNANEEYVLQELMAPLVLIDASKAPEDIDLSSPLAIIPINAGGDAKRLQASATGEMVMNQQLARAQQFIENVTGSTQVRTEGRMKSSITTGRGIEKAQGPLFGRIEYRNDLNSFRLEKLNELSVLMTEAMFGDEEISLFGTRTRRGGMFRIKMKGSDLQGYTYNKVIYSPSMHMGLSERITNVLQLRGAQPRPLIDERTAIEVLGFSDHPDEMMRLIEREMEADVAFKSRLERAAKGGQENDPLAALRERASLEGGGMPQPQPEAIPSEMALAGGGMGGPAAAVATALPTGLPPRPAAPPASGLEDSPDRSEQVRRALAGTSFKSAVYLLPGASIVVVSTVFADAQRAKRKLSTLFDRVSARAVNKIPDGAIQVAG